jgi:hypothetical protein
MEIYTVTHDGNMVDEYADSNDFVKVNSVPGRTMRIIPSIPGLLSLNIRM